MQLHKQQLNTLLFPISIQPITRIPTLKFTSFLKPCFFTLHYFQAQTKTPNQTTFSSLHLHLHFTQPSNHTMSFKSKILPTKPRGKVIFYTTCLLLIFIPLIALILAFTVLKPKHPVTTITSISIDTYNLSFDLLTMRPLLNLTLDLQVTVTNPNKAGFKYSHGSVYLYYKHQLVGYAPVPPGEVSAGGSESIRMMLTVFADRLVSDSELVGDVTQGEIVFVNVTKLSGKAVIMKMIRFKLSSETSCDLKVDVLNRSAENYNCKYKTKF